MTLPLDMFPKTRKIDIPTPSKHDDLSNCA